jgi:hypothetical protein
MATPYIGNSSAAPAPLPISMSKVKEKLLRPSLSSQYQVWFNPPQTVKDWLKFRDIDYTKEQEYFSLSCSEASLPGSSLTTFEINNDYTGVTQRHAYRRLYDDRADFTCYVDTNHQTIRLFEGWMSYIVDEQFSKTVRGGLESKEYYYRVQYPKDYKTTLYIHKFEKDFNHNFVQVSGYTPRLLRYSFLEAFPTSINSIPVSYESSTLLKVTVSFAYTRYIMDAPNVGTQTLSASNTNTLSVNPGSGGEIPGTTNVTNEYYNNFGDPTQDNTNFGRGIA